MSKMKGPAIFLAQFAGSEAPFDNLANIAGWAGGLYQGRSTRPARGDGDHTGH